MLAVLFVLLGAFGIFLNWLVLISGLFASLTHPLGKSSTTLIPIISNFSQGISRLDGWIVILVAVILLITIFIHTTNSLLFFRSFTLAAASLLLLGELLNAITAHMEFYTYAGLLYTTVFFFLAFVAAIFKMGSKRSLNSTLQGIPMSESQALTQTLANTLKAATISLRTKLTPLEDISDEWKKGVSKEFSDTEIKFGRDSNWATVPIGAQWKAVSRKHGILKVIGKTLYYEPLSFNYAFSVNGVPHQNIAEVPSGSTLSLVSGYGPSFKVNYSMKESGVSLKTINQAARFAGEEFKRLQGTMKLFVIIAILGLPFFGGVSVLQDKAYRDYIKRSYAENRELKAKVENLRKVIEEYDTLIAKKRGYLAELNAKIAKLQEELEREKQRRIYDRQKIDSLKSEINKLSSLRKNIVPKEILDSARSVIAIIDKELQNLQLVFPIVSIIKNKDSVGIGEGTGFFVRDQSGNVYAVTVSHVIGGDNSLNFLGGGREYVKSARTLANTVAEILMSCGINSVTDYDAIKRTCEDEKCKDKFDGKGIMFLPSNLWKRRIIIRGNGKEDGIAFLKFPKGVLSEEIVEKIPVVYMGEVPENAILGVIGYPNGIRNHNVGFLYDTTNDFIITSIQSFPGYSGSPLFLLSLNPDSLVPLKICGVTVLMRFLGEVQSYHFKLKEGLLE